MKKKRLLLFNMLLAVMAQGQMIKIDSTQYPKITNFTTQQDHEHMKQQLGIKTLRPGYSGNESAPNHANYDESFANPCPELHDVLTLFNGTKITTSEQWWKQRRPELITEFEKNVYGRIPGNVPKVSWSVKVMDREIVNRIPVIAKEIIGHVYNSAYPLINVDIKMRFLRSHMYYFIEISFNRGQISHPKIKLQIGGEASVNFGRFRFISV